MIFISTTGARRHLIFTHAILLETAKFLSGVEGCVCSSHSLP